MTKPLVFPDYLGKYQEQWIERLRQGSLAYGDRDRPVGEYLDEIQEECVDLAGWGYQLWLKCERLKREK
jgi:hypothetical protein